MFRVRTSFPFGSYRYTDRLGPKLLDVPLVVSLLWLGLFLTSRAAAAAFLGSRNALLAALLVTFFLAVLQFAAGSLDLWFWSDGVPPPWNFGTWFLFSFFGLSILDRFAGAHRLSRITAHLFVAQLVYFLLSDVTLQYVF